MDPIPNVLQERSAVCHGYLATRGVASCAAVIVTFVDSAMIFIEHISADRLFKSSPTKNGTQRRLELVVQHIFDQVSSSAVIESVLLMGGIAEPSYAALELAIDDILSRRTSISTITIRATSEQLRKFLDAIVLVRLQLNPTPLVRVDGKQVEYQVSIVVNMDNTNNSGFLMVSQLSEVCGISSDLLRTIIINVKSGDVLVAGEKSIVDQVWSFYPHPMSNNDKIILQKLAMLMVYVTEMKPLDENSSSDEHDIDDDTSDDGDV